MSTYTKLHFHIVFGTKGRVPCIDQRWRSRLWEYMGGTIRGLGDVPHGVGGWDDHVHLLIDLRPTHVLADVVRELKKASTAWIRQEIGVRTFSWQEGYGAFTVGYREREVIRQYIEQQEVHHRKKGSREELLDLLKEAGIEFDPKHLT
ncbi:MAG: IS200/IS605 family transposase [Flavobacteriales bacterium]|nr:IS200/IS605 family transposase [Flavobacteriales bacterium]